MTTKYVITVASLEPERHKKYLHSVRKTRITRTRWVAEARYFATEEEAQAVVKEIEAPWARTLEVHALIDQVK
jgi:hypothetical protein